MTLTDEARQQIQQARAGRKRIARAIGVANFNAWSATILALLSVLFVLFDLSFLSVAVVLILSAVAFVEFMGRAKLKKLQDQGLVMLAINQSALGLIILLYACWQLYVTAYLPGLHSELIEAGELGKQIADMVRTLSLLVYALLIPATIIFQGGMAWFYLHTRKALRQFTSETPPWVIDLLNAAT